MGKYVNVNLKGNPLNASGKASELVLSGAERIEEPNAFDQHEGKSVLCVVENGLFDAVAFAYNQAELDEFKRDDGRFKTWLTVDESVIETLID
jgi:hypothetical protein